MYRGKCIGGPFNGTIVKHQSLLLALSSGNYVWDNGVWRWEPA